MQVRFYATLRRIVGAKSVEIHAPTPTTVRGLVAAIVAQYPDLEPILRIADGRLPRGVHVFLNGRGAGYLAQGLDTPVTQGDTVDVFPAVAGG